MNIIIPLLAILPGLFICYAIYRYDKYNQEPALALAICFLLGMAITYPAIEVERFADQQGWGGDGVGGVLLVAFVFVAFNEELLKNLVVVLYPFNRDFFDEPLDGIVYAVMASMGFATVENLIYATRFGLETTLVRSFTAVPAHACFAVLAGYFIGRAKFEPTKRFPLLGLGLLAAVIPHGLYDFFILQEIADWMIGLVIPLLGFCVFMSIKLIRQTRSNFAVTTDDILPTQDQQVAITTKPISPKESTRYDQFFSEEEE